MHRLIALFAALAAATTLIACSGGDSSTSVRTLGPGEVRSVGPKPTLVASSGLPEVDAVMVNAIARDDIALAGLAGYSRVACRADGEEGDGPLCREDEDSGDEVEVLAASGCETLWIRPENVPDAFRLALAPEPPSVVAVYVPANSESRFGGGFGATAAAVFSTGAHGDGAPKGAALHVRDGRVVWIQTSCANATELLDPAFIGSFIIEPPPAAQ